jgi:hypothetical protein
MIGLVTLVKITTNVNSSQSVAAYTTRSIPYWTTSVFSFYCGRLGSDLRMGHFFSFPCQLVNNPQLNIQLLTNSLTTEIRLNQSQSQSRSYVTTDGLSASLSWNKVPIWGLRPDFYYCQTVAGLLMWGALWDERTGLSFTIAAGPRQRSHSRVWVTSDSRPYSFASDSRLPFSSPLMIRRVTVEVFDPASTRDSTNLWVWVWVWLTLRLTVSQSVCLSWCRAPSGAHDQILVTVWQFLFYPWGGGALSDERVGLSLAESFSSNKSIVSMYSYIHLTCFTFWHIYTIYTRPLLVPAQYSRLCPISGNHGKCLLLARIRGNLCWFHWHGKRVPYQVGFHESAPP